MRATIGATKYVIALIISKWTFTVSYKSSHCAADTFQRLRLKLWCSGSISAEKDEKFLTVKLKAENFVWVDDMTSRKGGKSFRKFDLSADRIGVGDGCAAAYAKGIKFLYRPDWMQWNQFLLQIYRHRKKAAHTEPRYKAAAHGWSI